MEYENIAGRVPAASDNLTGRIGEVVGSVRISDRAIVFLLPYATGQEAKEPRARNAKAGACQGISTGCRSARDQPGTVSAAMKAASPSDSAAQSVNSCSSLDGS